MEPWKKNIRANTCNASLFHHTIGVETVKLLRNTLHIDVHIYVHVHIFQLSYLEDRISVPLLAVPCNPLLLACYAVAERNSA